MECPSLPLIDIDHNYEFGDPEPCHFMEGSAMPHSSINQETLTHRLILPREANHHGTLYAGSLVALALEAAYSTGYRAIGDTANLVLKRVLDLRCLRPVPIGEVVQIRGRVVLVRSAQVVVGLYGSPLRGQHEPWMDSLMQFVQIDPHGHPLDFEPPITETFSNIQEQPWSELRDRTLQLLNIRRHSPRQET
ncbi:MAG: acyl-CoA thioesterase [bacterium]